METTGNPSGMSDKTKIQWADSTFNPWIGCTKVSPGCANCYAENTTRARVLRSQGHETWGKGKSRSRTSVATWKAPLRWNSEVAVHPDYRHKVFPSLCDWLDDEVPIEWLSDFLNLIRITPHLDWLLLTKRPENFADRIGAVPFEFWDEENPPSNVWVGVSVEDQKRADERIPILLNIPAKVRFLSVEPMLGPIDLKLTKPVPLHDPEFGDQNEYQEVNRGIQWAIFGGESGSKARPCNVEWIRQGVMQCQEAGVAPFVKQLGAFTIEELGSQRVRVLYEDKKGGDINEFPEDLKVREFPHCHSNRA
jgi:protein gp37